MLAETLPTCPGQLPNITEKGAPNIFTDKKSPQEQNRPPQQKSKGQHPRRPLNVECKRAYCGVLLFIEPFSAFSIFTEATSICPVEASSVPMICT